MLTVAAALPLGNIVTFNYQMLAHGRERTTLTPFAIGGGITITAAIAIVAVDGAREDLVAVSMLAEQLATMAVLGTRVRATYSGERPEFDRATAPALLVGLLACASLLRGGTVVAGLALVVLTAVLGASLWTVAHTLLADLRRRPRRPPRRVRAHCA